MGLTLSLIEYESLIEYGDEQSIFMYIYRVAGRAMELCMPGSTGALADVGSRP
jgi:hypothetical protein